MFLFLSTPAALLNVPSSVYIIIRSGYIQCHRNLEYKFPSSTTSSGMQELDSKISGRHQNIAFLFIFLGLQFYNNQVIASMCQHNRGKIFTRIYMNLSLFIFLGIFSVLAMLFFYPLICYFCLFQNEQQATKNKVIAILHGSHHENIWDQSQLNKGH